MPFLEIHDITLHYVRFLNVRERMRINVRRVRSEDDIILCDIGN